MFGLTQNFIEKSSMIYRSCGSILKAIQLVYFFFFQFFLFWRYFDHLIWFLQFLYFYLRTNIIRYLNFSWNYEKNALDECILLLIQNWMKPIAWVNNLWILNAIIPKLMGVIYIFFQRFKLTSTSCALLFLFECSGKKIVQKSKEIRACVSSCLMKGMSPLERLEVDKAPMMQS